LWFIESHFASEITLDDVADVAGVSRYGSADSRPVPVTTPGSCEECARNGAPGWTQTSGPQLRRLVLYSAELRARNLHRTKNAAPLTHPRMQRRIDKRAIRAGKPRLESWGLALEGPYARFDGFDHNSGRSAKSSALRRVPVRVWCGLGRREAWVRIPPPQPLSRGQS